MVENAFEADGDLSRVYGKAGQNSPVRTYADGFSFTAAGGISQMRLGNGRWETAKFNERLQVTELGLGNSATDASLWKLNYEFGETDANGNVVASKNTGNIAKQTLSFAGLAAPLVQTYKYDSLYRLTEAKETQNSQQTWIQQFGYDRYGNRTAFNQDIAGSQQTNQTPSVNPQTNRLTSNNYSYDLNGNIITDVSDANQSRSFVFNGDNKQVEIKDAASNSVIGRYYYDGEGKRVKKVTNLETTIFIYDGLGKLIAEYSTDIAPTPQTKYLTEDHLGTPRIITDATGQITARRDFLPFGEDITAGVGARSASLKYGTTTDDIRQKFTGYQKDKESNLDFAEARMYENRHARFTAVDPLLASGKSANPQTFNRYVYCGNNPLIMVDPTGEKWAIRNSVEDGKPWVRFAWYDEKLTDDQIAEGWTDYDYKTNRFYVSDNYVWYLARDEQDAAMIHREQMDLINGEGSFGRLPKGPSGNFSEEDKKMMMDAVLDTLVKENRDPIARQEKEMGAMIAGAVAARGMLAMRKVTPELRPIPEGAPGAVNRNAPRSPAEKSRLAELRDVAVDKRIEQSGMTTGQAGKFFGWKSGYNTKGTRDFTKRQLISNGWTREVIKSVADGYRRIEHIDRRNISAGPRADQLERLLNLF